MKKFLPFLVVMLLSLIGCNQPQNAETATSGSNTGNIAFVNVDSLMEKYQFAKDLNEEFTKKQENMTADINVKAKKVEDMIKSFQYRLQNNGFASRERAEKEQRHIEKKRQELAQLNQTLQAELAEEYQGMVKRLQDTITTALEKFNEDKGFDLILQTSGREIVVLYGKPSLNITEEFVKQLNASYSPSSETKKEEDKTKKEEAKK